MLMDRRNRSRERMVMFLSGRLELEGVLTQLDARASPLGIGAVICHPHPLYGGNMENMVVWGICDALREAGAIALRFNFRGVGGSEGVHDNGVGEVEDVLAALDFLEHDVGVPRVTLAGYSFGAMMALRAAISGKADKVGRLALVALPALYFDEVDLGAREDMDVLLIGGEQDDIATPAGLRMYSEALRGPSRIEVLEGADHFFGGETAQIGRMVASHLLKV